MNFEILSVGTELLLGQISDTNSAWMGERLAANGISSYYHQAVGDNHLRITSALKIALKRSDGVIVCGGLGPTPDDITREAIADVMGVELRRDKKMLEMISSFFESRDLLMSANNARQADLPLGSVFIEQRLGTAPGLICPLGSKVIYALPGVPHEMSEMFERAVLPDLRRRMVEAGEQSVIKSRTLRTWGTSESRLAEVLQGRINDLDRASVATEVSTVLNNCGQGLLTIAFLASGMEGIKVRLTARAPSDQMALELLDEEEREVRSLIERELGNIIFGVDETSMEQAVANELNRLSMTLALAESVTGGLISSRLVSVPGASSWLRGAVVAYDSTVKYSTLGVPVGPVVSASSALAMAQGVQSLLNSNVGIGITGVAGPDEQEGIKVGTVFIGLAFDSRPSEVREISVPGDRERVRQYGATSALDFLRRALLEVRGGPCV